ncbi:MAG TPA: response regulator [Woeseiaceae bacterium]|nr:response regulator [Woeseiaceae bacterium]
MKVLIVEDDNSARDASMRYLDHIGYEVRAAASVIEAELVAAGYRPDVAICDWRLGGERDGAQLARELQKKYGSCIIFVTAHPLHDLRRTTQDLKVARYLRKPISLSVLVKILESIHLVPRQPGTA